ncbi:hypothetical protein TrispH2_006251 [Trichoplax sp. H2]|nr:hypothetical protein TrispH2_006251 [Trichoplax sp. H2]|eukprot:RDD40756.1 hypothetical protein TrispH2_006251 [Trichoplax sp. H2]
MLSAVPLLNDHDNHADRWTILKTTNNSFLCITCLIGNITSEATSKNTKKTMLSELYDLSSEFQSDFYTLLESELPVTNYLLKVILEFFDNNDNTIGRLVIDIVVHIGLHLIKKKIHGVLVDCFVNKLEKSINLGESFNLLQCLIDSIMLLLKSCLAKDNENAQLASSHLYYIIFDEGLGAAISGNEVAELLTEIPELILESNNVLLQGNMLAENWTTHERDAHECELILNLFKNMIFRLLTKIGMFLSGSDDGIKTTILKLMLKTVEWGAVTAEDLMNQNISDHLFEALSEAGLAVVQLNLLAEILQSQEENTTLVSNDQVFNMCTEIFCMGVTMEFQILLSTIKILAVFMRRDYIIYEDMLESLELPIKLLVNRVGNILRQNSPADDPSGLNAMSNVMEFFMKVVLQSFEVISSFTDMPSISKFAINCNDDRCYAIQSTAFMSQLVKIVDELIIPYIQFSTKDGISSINSIQVYKLIFKILRCYIRYGDNPKNLCLKLEISLSIIRLCLDVKVAFCKSNRNQDLADMIHDFLAVLCGYLNDSKYDENERMKLILNSIRYITVSYSEIHSILVCNNYEVSDSNGIYETSLISVQKAYLMLMYFSYLYGQRESNGPIVQKNLNNFIKSNFNQLLTDNVTIKHILLIYTINQNELKLARSTQNMPSPAEPDVIDHDSIPDEHWFITLIERQQEAKELFTNDIIFIRWCLTLSSLSVQHFQREMLKQWLLINETSTCDELLQDVAQTIQEKLIDILLHLLFEEEPHLTMKAARLLHMYLYELHSSQVDGIESFRFKNFSELTMMHLLNCLSAIICVIQQNNNDGALLTVIRNSRFLSKLENALLLREDVLKMKVSIVINVNETLPVIVLQYRPLLQLAGIYINIAMLRRKFILPKFVRAEHNGRILCQNDTFDYVKNLLFYLQNAVLQGRENVRLASVVCLSEILKQHRSQMLELGFGKNLWDKMLHKVCLSMLQSKISNSLLYLIYQLLMYNLLGDEIIMSYLGLLINNCLSPYTESEISFEALGLCFRCLMKAIDIGVIRHSECQQVSLKLSLDRYISWLDNRRKGCELNNLNDLIIDGIFLPRHNLILSNHLEELETANSLRDCLDNLAAT